MVVFVTGPIFVGKSVVTSSLVVDNYLVRNWQNSCHTSLTNVHQDWYKFSTVSSQDKTDQTTDFIILQPLKGMIMK